MRFAEAAGLNATDLSGEQKMLTKLAKAAKICRVKASGEQRALTKLFRKKDLGQEI